MRQVQSYVRIACRMKPPTVLGNVAVGPGRGGNDAVEHTVFTVPSRNCATQDVFIGMKPYFGPGEMRVTFERITISRVPSR